MAGGKETPRQKMIGMMYLVLTALLALNVSSTVLDKFAFINESLERANAETSQRNARTITGMKSAAKDKGNRADDLKVVADAEALRAETTKIMAEMEEYKEKFVEITGGYMEGHKGDRRFIMGKTDYDKVGNYMMPVEEGGDGNGAEMREMLNGYAEYIQGLLKKNGADESKLKQYHKIALDADEDPIYQKDENQKGKKWSQLAFENSPTHAGLATVSEFQANVLSFETSALDFLVKRVGLKDITFDQIKPVIMPESQYVAAGTKYKADMFIAASASGLNDKLVMTYNGEEAPVVGGVGKVEFTATPGNYDKEGNAKKQIVASITVPQGGGTDTTFVDTIDYYVVRPVIQIQSQSVNALYYNCGNALDVQVPALGTQYNPSFSARGGDAIKGSQKGQVTVVPKSQKVTLTVSSGGNVIGSREFGVRAIPAPDIKVYTDAGEVNMKEGIPARTPKLYLRAIPDESFAQFLPNDAKFQVAEAEITLVSGGLGRGSIRAGQEVNLRGMSGRKGDQLVIEIKKVQRQNFRKQVETFPKHTRFINISLK
ncbi:gliding motility-associated protein GldM [Ekhidna lutea]|uniref:Gliding motility-associated protein GldM n=1 Tax=Ekhidna lutea TaxID=447679 RepID=A0A239FAU1_EKHLU|nr:gliding motility protein GldM [Ekhidna lutea]SNS53851.1 gliding motility-associated protein GldM [Ekhidna lutea]